MGAVWTSPAVVLPAGLGLLAFALLGPDLLGLADPGDARVRWTVRVALLFWFLTLVGRLRGASLTGPLRWV